MNRRLWTQQQSVKIWKGWGIQVVKFSTVELVNFSSSMRPSKKKKKKRESWLQEIDEQHHHQPRPNYMSIFDDDLASRGQIATVIIISK